MGFEEKMQSGSAIKEKGHGARSSACDMEKSERTIKPMVVKDMRMKMSKALLNILLSYIFFFFNNKEFITTETLLKAMARPAYSARKSPKAAIGIPMLL